MDCGISEMDLLLHRRLHSFSTVCSGVHEIKYHRWIPLTKGQLRGKCTHVMTSDSNDVEVILDRMRKIVHIARDEQHEFRQRKTPS